VVILANPRAGAKSSRGLVDDLVDRLLARKLQPTVCWDRVEFSESVHSLDPKDLRCVVAAGGDGTLIEALNRAPGRPIALLPLGTENLMARTWHIERSGHRVADTIAAGRVRTLDMARLRRHESPDRLFTLMAGIGFDGDVVRRTHAKRRGHINLFSYAWPFVQAVSRYRFPFLDIEVVETGERLRGANVFVFNLPRYGGGLSIAPEARGDDGVLDLLVFEKRGLFHFFRYLTSIIRGLRHRLRDVQHRLIRGVRLWSESAVPVQTDGDPAGFLPIEIQVVPSALSLVVPTVIH
jgi:diacylglycerol kinase family enzyme